MKHVAIPTTTLGGAKKLTPDQRNLLIILEDATLRFAGAETFAISGLKELKTNALGRSYCADVQETIRRRMMEIRSGWGGDRADGYEDRSMISPDYARNFICDFIIGKTQEHTQLELFNQ